MIISSSADYRVAAQKFLPPFLFHYIDGGAYAEQTLRRNVDDFAAVALRQRVLKDMSQLDTSIELFGEKLSIPVALSPVGLTGMYRRRPLEVAATLRAGPWDSFFHVALPLARPGFVTATILGFAHTVGEFGVVLMIGGNIPDKTRVVSVAIYDHVEALEYAEAHWLAGGMLAFSFVVLLALYGRRRGSASGGVG